MPSLCPAITIPHSNIINVTGQVLETVYVTCDNDYFVSTDVFGFTIECFSDGNSTNWNNVLICRPIPSTSTPTTSANATSTQNTSANDCSLELQKNPEDIRCRCAHKEAESSDSMLPYSVFLYCYFSPQWYWVGGILMALWAMFLFYFMADTADKYLVPSLKITTSALRLSPNVAGVTLLAFANGAPDLFSAVAAFSQGPESVELGLGLLVGGMIYVPTVVYGAVAITKAFDTYRRPFLRDVSFLLITALTLYFTTRNGSMTQGNSFIFLGLYVVYVFIVVFGRAVYQRHKKRKESKTNEAQQQLLDPAAADPADDSKKDSVTDHGNGVTDWVEVESTSLKKANKKHFTGVFHETLLDSKGTKERHRRKSNDPMSLNDMASGHVTTSRSYEKKERINGCRGHLYEGFRVMFVQEFEDRGVFGRLVFLMEAPIVLLRMLTVPVLGEESDDDSLNDEKSVLDGDDDDDDDGLKWNKSLCIISCIWAPSFVLFCFGDIVKAFPYTLAIGCVMAILVAFMLNEHISPSLYIQPIKKIDPSQTGLQAQLARPIQKVLTSLCLLVVALAASASWTMFFAADLVELLVVLASVVGMPRSLVGATVLTWGNSVGDLAANLALARNGEPRMAAAGCFGGPLFNVLIGGGLSFVFATSGAPLKFNKPSAEEFWFVWGALVIILIATPINKFRISRLFGIGLICTYMCYLIFLVYKNFVCGGQFPCQ